jgi:hypothetical protein
MNNLLEKKLSVLENIENVEKIVLLEEGAYNLWYKAWAYVEDNTLFVGRYTDVLKGRTRKDIMNLEFGLYTSKAYKSTGLQTLFSIIGKRIDENNCICNKIDKTQIKEDLFL